MNGKYRGQRDMLMAVTGIKSAKYRLWENLQKNNLYSSNKELKEIDGVTTGKLGFTKKLCPLIARYRFYLDPI